MGYKLIKLLSFVIIATHLQEVLLQGVGLQPRSVAKSTSDFLSVLEGSAEVLKVRDTSMGR